MENLKIELIFATKEQTKSSQAVLDLQNKVAALKSGQYLVFHTKQDTEKAQSAVKTAKHSKHCGTN